MSSAIESQGTTLEIESGSGAAVTITGIALGSPTILTAVEHGLTNGEVVTLSNFGGTDAALINGQVAVVTNVTDDTFAVDIDTTDLTITDNSDAAVATADTYTEVSEITDFEGPGTGSAAVIDVTHLSSTRKEKRMGLPDEGQCTFSLNWIPGDPGQEAVKAARAARALKSYRVTFSDLSTGFFDAYCLSFGPSGSVDGKVSGKLTLEITGEVLWNIPS